MILSQNSANRLYPEQKEEWEASGHNRARGQVHQNVQYEKQMPHKPSIGSFMKQYPQNTSLINSEEATLGCWPSIYSLGNTGLVLKLYTSVYYNTLRYVYNSGVIAILLWGCCYGVTLGLLLLPRVITILLWGCYYGVTLGLLLLYYSVYLNIV